MARATAAPVAPSRSAGQRRGVSRRALAIGRRRQAEEKSGPRESPELPPLSVSALGPCRPLSVVAVLLLCACSGTLPPLRGQIEVGRDAYAVFVAGAGPAGGDLYAVRAEGGAALPITFTNVGEMRPRLSPDGVSVVFLRGRSLTDSTPATVWVMNLPNGGEHELSLPKGSARPTAAAWADGGRTSSCRRAPRSTASTRRLRPPMPVS